MSIGFKCGMGYVYICAVGLAQALSGVCATTGAAKYPPDGPGLQQLFVDEQFGLPALLVCSFGGLCKTLGCQWQLYGHQVLCCENTCQVQA